MMNSCDSTVEVEVMKVLDEWQETFSRRDMEAWEKTYHFPHYRLGLASGEMRVLPEPGTQDPGSFKRLEARGWHYSKWTRRKIIHASDTKVHVDVQFTRCRKDHTPIESFDALYIVTKVDGRWGVKMRSSYAA
jgi:hypothetical protein